MTKQATAMTYRGAGFVLGVPARDLTEDEVKALGGEKALLATGLYDVVKKQAPAQPKKAADEDGE